MGMLECAQYRTGMAMSAQIGESKNPMLFYRQGDVLLRQVAQLPTEAVPVANDSRVVLAHGEVTGHAHFVDAAGAREFRLAEAAGMVRRFLKVAGGATVVHEEHGAIPLPPGIYEILQQREYSPEEIRSVQD